MFGIEPKLPITDEERVWVDEGFRRLSLMLGAHRLTSATVVLPNDEFFPDHYDKSVSGMGAVFRRICAYMRVDPARVDLEIIPDGSDLREMLPEYHHASNDPAGLHFGETRDERALIAVRQSQLEDPLRLIATLAHELAHVVLLDGGHMSRDVPDINVKSWFRQSTSWLGKNG